MKKAIKIFALAFALVAAIGLAACSNQKDIDGSPQRLTVNLEYNAGTGFEWRNSIGTDEKNQPLKVVDMQTIDNSKNGTVGGPLVDQMVFEAEKTGKTTMVFTLARAWELDENASPEDIAAMAAEELPEGTVVITADVTVGEDGSISVDKVEPAEYESWFVVE